MRILSFLLFLIPFTLQAQEVEWPDLNSIKYVSGRIAKEADIDSKAAIFTLKIEGQYIGAPIKIELPQYAIYTDSETNKKHKVVVIQAESAQGMNMFGAINIKNGSSIVSIDNDFSLLGKNIKK